ncbi:MAG TPA: hypothetical protein VLL51_10105, partial [Gemmatimonadales bacterium]|nr:hypothetical protein [Gemmatimonadales bacterium]
MIGSAHGPHGEPVDRDSRNIIGSPGSGQPGDDDLVRPRLVLVGDVGARPDGLERGLVRGGFEVAEVPMMAAGTLEPAVVLLTAAGEVDAAGSLDILRHRLPAGVPVVITLLEVTPEGVTRLLEAGAADVVSVPVHPPELIARLGSRVRAGEDAAAALRVSDQTSRLFDVFQDISVTFRTEEVLHTLVRRVGDVLGLSHSACVLASPGQEEGRMVAAREQPDVRELPVPLWQYP